MAAVAGFGLAAPLAVLLLAPLPATGQPHQSWKLGGIPLPGVIDQDDFECGNSTSTCLLFVGESSFFSNAAAVEAYRVSDGGLQCRGAPKSRASGATATEELHAPIWPWSVPTSASLRPSATTTPLAAATARPSSRASTRVLEGARWRHPQR